MHPTNGNRDPVQSPPLTAADWAAIAVALVLPTVVTWIYFVALHGAPQGLQQTAYGIGKTIQFALPILWVWRVQRRRIEILAPGTSWHFAGVAFGLSVAVAMALLYGLVLKRAGLFEAPALAVRAKIQSFGAASLPAYALLALFYSLIHSLLEEYYWRWFVFGQLDRGLRLPAAVAISSVGFAAHHVLVLAHYFGWTSPFTWLFTACIVIGGAFWAWLYRRSASLYAPWISHAIVDAAIFAIGFDLLQK